MRSMPLPENVSRAIRCRNSEEEARDNDERIRNRRDLGLLEDEALDADVLASAEIVRLVMLKQRLPLAPWLGGAGRAAPDGAKNAWP
jgi:hypothetical protein